VWERQSGRVKAAWPAHTQAVLCCTLSDDPALLATATAYHRATAALRQCVPERGSASGTASPSPQPSASSLLAGPLDRVPSARSLHSPASSRPPSRLAQSAGPRRCNSSLLRVPPLRTAAGRWDTGGSDSTHNDEDTDDDEYTDATTSDATADDMPRLQPPSSPGTATAPNLEAPPSSPARPSKLARLTRATTRAVVAVHRGSRMRSRSVCGKGAPAVQVEVLASPPTSAAPSRASSVPPQPSLQSPSPPSSPSPPLAPQSPALSPVLPPNKRRHLPTEYRRLSAVQSKIRSSPLAQPPLLFDSASAGAVAGAATDGVPAGAVANGTAADAHSAGVCADSSDGASTNDDDATAPGVCTPSATRVSQTSTATSVPASPVAQAPAHPPVPAAAATDPQSPGLPNNPDNAGRAGGAGADGRGGDDDPDSVLPFPYRPPPDLPAVLITGRRSLLGA